MQDADLFDIPAHWKWVPLGRLCIMLSRGKSPKYSEEEKYPVFAQKCNQPSGLELWKARFLDESTLDKWPEYFRLRDGDVVINSTGTGTVGRIGYYCTDTLNPKFPFMLPDSHVTVARLGNGIISKYIYYVLRSPSLQSIMEKNFRGSTNQKEFYIDSVYSTPIPIPPTEEQKIIVEKLDILFEKLMVISKLQELYANDIEILKNKLIDFGIQGRLTEQLESDGNSIDVILNVENERKKQEDEGIIKAVKRQDEVSEEDIPFKIPDNWKWVRFGNVAYIVRGGSPRPIKQYITNDSNGINWIKIGDVEKGGKYIIDTKEKIIPEGEKKSRKVYPGDFLLTNSMSFGRPYISRIEGCIHDGWLLIHDLKAFNQDYLYYLLSSGYLYEQFCKKASGATVDNLNIDKVSSAIIPLPPLSEQKRIADKLDSILSYINKG